MQDIIKHEAAGTALRPGPGASQQAGWRTANRYRPYEGRITGLLLRTKSTSHGVSLAGLEAGDVDGVEG